MNNKARDTYPKGFMIGLVVVSMVGLLTGYEVLRWSIRIKTGHAYEEFLYEATAITRQINLARVKSLSFTAADRDRADFLRLSAQWLAYTRITQYSAMYGVAWRDGRYVFGPGYRKGADVRTVSPGQVYESPPQGLIEAFKTHQPQVNGPYREGGRTWVSAWVPVIDPSSEDVLMVLVISTDGSVWSRQFIRVWWGAALFTLLMMVCIALAMVLVRRKKRIPMDSLVPVEVVLTLALGVIFTVTFWRMTRDLEGHARLKNFQLFARPEMRDVSEQMVNLRTRIEALTLVLGGENDVNRENFVRYASTATKLSFAETWSWVSLVPSAEVRSFEARQHQGGAPGFALWQKDEEDKRSPVSKRDLYYPVVYSENRAADEALSGLDCGSDPDLRQALETALRTGMITGTTSAQEIRVDREHPRLYIFEPVYVSGASPSKLSGVILVVLDLAKVMRQAFMPLISNGSASVSAIVWQLGTDNQPSVLFSTSPDVQDLDRRWIRRPDDYPLSVPMPLFFFGRAYALTVQAESAYYAAHPRRLGWLSFWVGGLLTLLLAGVVGYFANRRVILERLVQARTMELGRVNQRVSTILDTSGEGILAVDSEGRMTEVNASAAQRLGYGIHELIGRRSDVLLPPGWCPPESGGACPFYATYKYGSIQQQSDAVFRQKSGDEFPVAYVSKPIYEYDKVVGAVVTFHDITEQRDAAEKLRRANGELEKLNRALRDANQAKDLFVANMSHEIRTPLHSVIGMSGLLMETALSDEQQEYAETIRVSGESLLSVVNEILDFSKIEADKLELENQPFKLRQCVEDAVDVVAEMAAKKRLELICQIDERLPAALIGDVTRLRQILVNLLSNAIKFTDKGEVEVSVTGQARDGHAAMLHFRVRDTGLGISPESKSKLFTSFSQGDTSTTRRFGGTGLGLAISKRLCELMGGTMDAESLGVPGYGTTFRFSVLMEVDQSAREDDTPSEDGVLGKRVLIVASNATSLDALSQQVRALGMHPVPVGTAREACDTLTAVDLFGCPETFDLAVLDTLLSDMDGVALAKEIRAIPGREQLSLILLSPLGAHAQGSSRSLIAEQITKPVKLSHLYDAFMRLFSKQPARRQRTEHAPARFSSEVGRQHPLRILIAEDNVVNQKVALCILSKLGYRADTVSNGLEAVEAVKRVVYDLVLMDGQMPEMDGAQAAIQIRKVLPASLQPKIVAMTANVMKPDRERYQMAGMNDYISKPVRIDRLVEVLLSVTPVISRNEEGVPNG